MRIEVTNEPGRSVMECQFSSFAEAAAFLRAKHAYENSMKKPAQLKDAHEYIPVTFEEEKPDERNGSGSVSELYSFRVAPP